MSKFGNKSSEGFPRLKQHYLAVSVSAAMGALAMGVGAPEAVAQDDRSLVLQEIVVTARRESESLQDVPVSVQAISGDQLQELAMKNVTDIAKLAPGLNLYLPEPSAPVVVLRGVRWTPGSGTPAVPFYLNEVPFDPAPQMQTMYDIGQVEVLRGPQGTSRGAPSISGAITLTSRRPEMDAFSGYVSGLAGEGGHKNLEAAVNVPLIENVLAVRVAGQFDDSEANRIKSVNDSSDPEREAKSGRISVSYQPTDTLTFDAMFQRLDTTGDVYTQVVGPGAAGRPALGPTYPAIPANFNGPRLDLNDYRGVQEGPDSRPYEYDHMTFNVVWEVLGHTLSYNYGSQENVGGFNGYSSDVGNVLIGLNPLNKNRPEKSDFDVHELRLSSIRDDDNFVDYDLGFYYNKVDSLLAYESPSALLPGAYGNPFAGAPAGTPFLDPAQANYYQLVANYAIGLETENKSFYGDLTFHLSEVTELRVGARYIEDERPTNIAITLPPAPVVAAPLAAFAPAPSCSSVPGFSASPFYGASVCDTVVNAPAPAPQSFTADDSTTIWNASLSHRFSDEVLAYLTVGTSWRQGLPSIGNAGLPGSLAIAKPEEATSYEIGVKTEWNSNLRVNASLYQIDYTDQLNQFRFAPYYNEISGGTGATNTSFFANVDAQVQGAEVEIQLVPVDNLTLGLNLSYAKIESEGGEVPCTDPSRPLTAENPMNFCPAQAGASLNASPEFQANLSGSYVVPFATAPYEGYIRVLANYQGDNDNFGASEVKADSYTLVDLFMGIQANDGGWDVGFYGKNIFDELTLLTQNPITTGLAGADQLFGPSGYNLVTATVPRELGVSFRYNFGVY